MNHVVEDNTREWDARVQAEQRRKRKVARLAHIGMSSAVLLGLSVVALGFALHPEQLPAVAAATPAPTTAAGPSHVGIPLGASFPPRQPESEVLDQQAQDLAVGLARIWRGGKSEGATQTAHSYTVEYERVVGCDLRWIAGQAGPGVWKGTLSLVRSLHEITPHVGRAREGQAVVVTAVICPA